MSFKPPLVSVKSHFGLTMGLPGTSTFTSAEIALIDSVFTTDVLQPYAYTATVKDDYEHRNFCLNTSANIVAGAVFSFGVFLSAQADKGNFAFECKGSVVASFDNALRVIPFFGRTSSGTITSSKAAPSNDLSGYIVLPFSVWGNTSANTTASVSELVIGDADSDDTPWCFGFALWNSSASTAATQMRATLQMRKYVQEDSIFMPSGM